MDIKAYRRYGLVIMATAVLCAPFWGSLMQSAGTQLTAGIIQSLVVKPTPPLLPVPTPIYPPVENRENSSQYSFINPLLFTETDKRFFPEFNAFNNQINAYIRSAINSRRADSVSVYYRDMNSGHWTGVNEDKSYEPSSMLKVLVMISYYMKASDPLASTSVDSFLAQKLYYPGSDVTGQNYPPMNVLPAGSYSMQDLIDDMIVNSDNVALNVLESNDQDGFNHVYKDFRLPPVPSGDPTDYMTAKSYAVVFRTLYNSTYLPWDISEKALKLLASTTFTQGLVAGVPPGTVVSHKFGEHTNIGPNNRVMWHELHDCGIVYYDSRPYLLCVMTSGQDFSKLETVVSGISTMVYQYVSALPPPVKN